jgi:small ligand-binding sensory domain FIST
MSQMSFESAIASHSDLDQALSDLLEQVKPGWQIDVAILFVSTYFTNEIDGIVNRLQAELKPGVLLGCTAEGVIGGEKEIENEPAISLVVAHLPGVQVTPFMLQPGSNEWHRMLLSPGEFCRVVDVPADTHLFMLLADPFSTPIDDVLLAFTTCYPGIPMVGGMASGALRPNGNILIANDYLTRQGAVGLAFSGNLSVDIIVSQGCRPIWRPFRVQSAHRNMIYNLEGRPPLAWLQDLIPELSEEDRALLQNGLFVGRAIDPGLDEMGRGDFIIRGLMGIDQENGAIAISDSVMEGEYIQFHLRDAITAQEDLEMLLIPQMFRKPPSGGLLFTCNGRGTRLYDHPNGDISIIQKSIQDIRLAGFFCAGEIGPVANQNFMHGQTVSLALFRPLHEPDEAAS